MPKQLEDLAGMRFDRLIVLRFVGIEKGRSTWHCRCDCGSELAVRAANLKSHNTRSCGCLVKDVAAEMNTKHGRSRSPEHRAWMGMWDRCTNPNYPLYGSYGGRGIAVADRWRSFVSFYADMGEKPSPKHSLDRIDVNGNYEPANCQWATMKEQARNKRNSFVVTAHGITASLAEHCERTGVSYNRAYYWIRKGQEPELVFGHSLEAA